MKPLLVGSDNPRIDDSDSLTANPEEAALARNRLLSTGWRIATMIKRRYPDAPEDFYEQEFDRANIEDDPSFQGRRDVVLLGREVQLYVLGQKGSFGSVYGKRPRYHCFPHPSGRCRDYNDESARTAFAERLMEIVKNGKCSN